MVCEGTWRYRTTRQDGPHSVEVLKCDGANCPDWLIVISPGGRGYTVAAGDVESAARTAVTEHLLARRD